MSVRLIYGSAQCSFFICTFAHFRIYTSHQQISTLANQHIIFYLSQMKTLRPLLLVLILAAGCSSTIDPKYISERNWVYESGFKVQDLNVLDFKSGTFELVHDTIFLNGQPQAVATALYKGDNVLEIKSLKGEEGKYLDMVEYTR